jgi:hypothetical protein
MNARRNYRPFIHPLFYLHLLATEIEDCHVMSDRFRPVVRMDALACRPVELPVPHPRGDAAEAWESEGAPERGMPF